ncbi:crossover junction endodeoxyribonuclease RuvC [Humidisolicoccus flavus]|uniref:crossover junction endodeoxyribonuclease RuvC n=1 Tax=Humidisolicoccus flavus TaxID=3111414 RepID=UPI0032540346
MRVLGIDPGLTRCGVGVIDMVRRTPSLVHVDVLRSAHTDAIESRLLEISTGVDTAIDTFQPDRIALERVFAQANVRSVMGVAQISGIVLLAAAKRQIPVTLHTPNQVKSAVTGYGSAEKKQVQIMVQKILGLDAMPKPADAADALAIAICDGWAAHLVVPSNTHASRVPHPKPTHAPTPAQALWRAAEQRAANGAGAARRGGSVGRGN